LESMLKTCTKTCESLKSEFEKKQTDLKHSVDEVKILTKAKQEADTKFAI